MFKSDTKRFSVKTVFNCFISCAALIFVFVFAVPVHAARRPGLTIAAAADLSFALKEIAVKFEESTGIKSVISLGSSGNLAKQIENGAPFDVFFAANARYLDELDKKGLVVSATKRLYARGRIVLAVNKKNRVKLNSLSDLLDASIKHIAIANPAHAPYGAAAKDALTKKGLWGKLEPKIVYGENIRQTLQYIETGNAEAGIVALSVVDVPDINYVLIEEGLHEPIDQAVAVIKASKYPKEAAQFIEFVNTPASRAIMKRYGFKLPGEF